MKAGRKTEARRREKEKESEVLIKIE